MDDLADGKKKEYERAWWIETIMYNEYVLFITCSARWKVLEDSTAL